MNKRAISVSHLVFGLVFLGAAALWAVGAATDADAPDLAIVAPAVLIGAGVVGLVAMVVNARNGRLRTEAPPHDTHPAYADTGDADPEEQL